MGRKLLYNELIIVLIKRGLNTPQSGYANNVALTEFLSLLLLQTKPKASKFVCTWSANYNTLLLAPNLNHAEDTIHK